jgi:hypothetical protein
MSPYGGGHGGGSHQSAGGYGGSTGGHVSAPIAQSYQQPMSSYGGGHGGSAGGYAPPIAHHPAPIASYGPPPQSAGGY